MARNKIDWDLWLDKPYAKLWIAQVVFFILSMIFFVATFALLAVKVFKELDSIAAILSIVIISILAGVFYCVAAYLFLIRELKIIYYRRNRRK